MSGVAQRMNRQNRTVSKEVNEAMSKKAGKPTKRISIQLSQTRFEEMVEDATVDAYNDSEQAVGWYTMICDHLDLPFDTTVLGVSVTVDEIDINEMDEIAAICRTGKHEQRMPVRDLPLPTPLPPGAEWIEAYRLWSKGSL